MRTADDEHELLVETYGFFADRDPLTRAVMDRSSPAFRRASSPWSASCRQGGPGRLVVDLAKSTISELFGERTRTALGELMSRRLEDVRLAVMMLDGLEIADRTPSSRWSLD